MYAKNLKIHKGTDNVLLFNFINQDQKPVNNSTATFTFRLMNREGTDVLLSKTMDAINATKAAVEEGIVPGGGTTLAHLAPALEEWANGNLSGEELIGANIVAAALTAPLMRIAENAGANGAVVAENVKSRSNNEGYNAANGDYVDMLAAGIVDPAKVTRSGLQNAASIAGMVLTTECIVADLPEKKDAAPAGGGMGGGDFDY